METAPPATARAAPLKGRMIVIAIAIFKLFHACLMMLLAGAALLLARPGNIDQFHSWINDWVDALDDGPYRRHLGSLVANGMLHLNVRTLSAIALGAAIYATVFLVEGAGLLLDKLWAEWMVVVSTSLLIPLEVTEIVRKRGILMTGTFIVNIAILIYLIIHVRRHIAARQAQMNSTGASTSA